MWKRLPLGLLLAGALTLAASCNKGQEVVDGLSEIRDAACACEDQECADGVLTRFVDFATENKEARGTDDHIKKAGEITEKTFNCLLEAGASQEEILKAAEKLQALE